MTGRPKGCPKSTVTSYNIDNWILKEMDKLVKDGLYESKSQIMRIALSRFMMLNQKLDHGQIEFFRRKK